MPSRTGQKKDTKSLSCSSRAVRPVNVDDSSEFENSVSAISGTYWKRPLEVEKPHRAKKPNAEVRRSVNLMTVRDILQIVQAGLEANYVQAWAITVLAPYHIENLKEI